MWSVEIVSKWVDDGGYNRPKVFMDYAGSNLRDVTTTPVANIPPEPNLVVITGVVSTAVLAAMELDVDVVILSAEEVV
jgi:hypothetical protein